jgi:hypothetical protein
MRFVRSIVILALATVFAGCDILDSIEGSGHVRTETRDVRGFDKIELSGTGKLLIEQGDTESLAITTDDNLFKHIRTEVLGSTLKLSSKDMVMLDPSDGVTYKLVVKKLTALRLSGGTEVDAKGIKTDFFSITVSGAGSIKISGETKHQEITISGAGEYNAENFKSKHTSITVSGVGEAVLAASDTLEVNVSGAGEVKYIGDPVVTQHISGAASVEKKKE